MPEQCALSRLSMSFRHLVHTISLMQFFIYLNNWIGHLSMCKKLWLNESKHNSIGSRKLTCVWSHNVFMNHCHWCFCWSCLFNYFRVDHDCHLFVISKCLSWIEPTSMRLWILDKERSFNFSSCSYCFFPALDQYIYSLAYNQRWIVQKLVFSSLGIVKQSHSILQLEIFH